MTREIPSCPQRVEKRDTWRTSRPDRDEKIRPGRSSCIVMSRNVQHIPRGEGDENLLTFCPHRGVHPSGRPGAGRHDWRVRGEACAVGCPHVDPRCFRHSIDDRAVGLDGHEVAPAQVGAIRPRRRLRGIRRRAGRCVLRPATGSHERCPHNAKARTCLAQSAAPGSGCTRRGIETMDDIKVTQAGHGSTLEASVRAVTPRVAAPVDGAD